MSNPSGLCKCGCGRQTKIATYSKPLRGIAKGEPLDFLQGHYRRDLVPIADPSRRTVEERGYETPCWITHSPKDKDGYGILIGGKRSLRGNERAHRRSYEENVGPIPERWHIDHLCEQPGCVRPDHLQALSSIDHMRRHSALTIDMVRAIRASPKTQQALAKEYGVTRSHIGYIRRHQVWIDQDS